MNKEINKKISQFLDDDLHYRDEESLLRKIREQPELNNKMKRYQAVSQVLKTDDFVIANQSFLDNINQELKQEPHYFLPRQVVKKRPIGFWQKTSVAIAASVALVAVMVSQQTSMQNTESQQGAVVVAQKQPIEPPPTQLVNESQHERFKAYLQAHSDDLYTHGSLSYQPYARVANYGRE